MNKAFPSPVLQVNGQPHTVMSDPGRRLSEVLREDCGLRGTKVGCDAGDCGACTVLLDGAPVCACLTPSVQATGREITTVEGLTAEKSALQQAFLRHGAAQCGICTPGMLMAASALLRDVAKPDRQQVEDALGGVLCRCTGYAKIIDAVMDVSPADTPDLPKADAVGARVERLDGVPKVEGTEIYGADHVPSDCLEVRAIRSPHHSASFVLGDVKTWAKNAKVFTARDIPGQNCFGVIPAFADQPALAEDRARFKGEAIAIVVGETDALAALDFAAFPVKWTPLNGSTRIAPGADKLHDNRPQNKLIQGFVQTGDAEAALLNAAHVAETSIEWWWFWIETGRVIAAADWAGCDEDRASLPHGVHPQRKHGVDHETPSVPDDRQDRL